MTAASLFYSTCVCVVTTFGFFAASEPTRHWFLVPVTLCGILVVADTLDWLRDFDPFDPGGLFAALGCHFFYLAPLLHVSRDHWMGEATGPPEWRDWLGGMAWLNLLGLLAFYLTRQAMMSRPLQPEAGANRRLDRPLFLWLATLGLLVSAVLQAFVYVRFGGIRGFIETAMDHSEPQRLSGMGALFMFSESFPILAMMVYAVLARGRRTASSWPVLLVVIVAFFVLKMLFGGLRDNRMHTVWGLFWAVGIIHLWLRPIPRVVFVFGGIFVIAFMYLYGLYKGAGLEALDTFGDPAAQGALAQRTGRGFETLLLGDLGRSDVQALLLYRLTEPNSDCEYAWGRTYLGALFHLVPRTLWPDRPPDKTKEGTEAMFGRGAFNLPPEWISSRIYGLAGEAMLNFGPAAVPFAFALFGFVIGRIRLYLHALSSDDPRRLLSPYLVILGFSMLALDSDILLFQLIKDCLVPFLVLRLSITAGGEAPEPAVLLAE